MEIRQLALFFCIFVLVKCGYPPIGDEVQPGSVLLPATRRGRYLANIVRRQAVDGTGIKFNKDADRMNAESKKKVDVLSEELLPYIIAEQERRTTLYKRVMTAIQNGEKGVTIAEIRNKPPLIIRKGLMFRCPSNRVPKEPDGSGIIMCDGDIEPKPIMYDSCLSAEDKDLYVADNKYFFCNRHKVESSDLPRSSNGTATTVYGCSVPERTSLNYTSTKCALEDTDDVVVHYRYYPDRTYKFVTELDPDREVCDHWNPCQIGYIYSLPSPDQAISATDLWQDVKKEYVRPYQRYESVPRRLLVPEGYKFDGIWKGKDPYSKHLGRNHKVPSSSLKIIDDPSSKSRRRTFGSPGEYITICVIFKKFLENFFGEFFAVFLPKNGSGKEKSLEFVTFQKSTVELEAKKLTPMPQSAMEPVLLEFKCQKCRVQGIVVHGDDGTMHNVDSSKYKMIQMNDGRKALQLQLKKAKPTDFGTYMLTLQNEQGIDEVIQALQLHAPVKVLKAVVLKATSIIGAHFDQTIKYECDGCELTDVTCNGEPVTSSGRVSIVPGVKMISFNFPSFEDSNACVYMGLFKKDGNSYRKVLAVVETVSVTPATVEAPPYGDKLEIEVTITCQADCEVEKVTVNGGELENAATATNTRSSEDGPGAYFVATSTSIIIRVLEFSEMYEGIYMAVVKVGSEYITKTIAEVKGSGEEGGGESSATANPEDGASGAPAGEDGASGAPPGADGASGAPPGEDGASGAPPGEAGASGAPGGEDGGSTAAPGENGGADAPPADAPPADAPPADAPPADAPPADAPPADAPPAERKGGT